MMLAYTKSSPVPSTEMLTIDPRDLATAIERDKRAVKVTADRQSSHDAIHTVVLDEKSTNMTISFPNPSRSYDATRQAVRFWGYDRSMESSFVIKADALKYIQPDLRFDPVEILRALISTGSASTRSPPRSILRGGKGYYELNVADV